MAESAHTDETKASSPRIIVLCWSFENRLDQSGPLGYSFHLTEENASEWKNDPGAKLSKYVHNAEGGFMICTPCCEGFVNKSPPQELLKALENRDGAYLAITPMDAALCEGAPSWLTLTSGTATGSVSFVTSNSFTPSASVTHR